MTYAEVKQLVTASGSVEGIPPTAIADALVSARDPLRELDSEDVKTAAACAYELGKLGLGRETFLQLNR